MLMPYSSEVFPWTMLTRIFAGIASLSIFGNPLLIDYVHQKTKGLAAAESGLFGGVTVIFIAVVEFKIAS